MGPDVIVSKAARAALESAHPVQVVDDGKLVGIVDNEAILRVVVAEDPTVRADSQSALP